MANAYKNLAQDNPGPTLTAMYTVPASTEAVGTLFIANREAATNGCRVAFSPAGAAIQDDHYLLYDVPIPANDSIILNGISMAATDVLRVYGEDANVSFNFVGVEIT